MSIIKELLSRNVEVVIRNEIYRLEEYDTSLPLEMVMKEFEKAGCNELFLKDLKEGFETSTIKPLKEEINCYLKKHQLEKKFHKVKELFEQNVYHPSLNVESLEPKHLNVFSFRVDSK